MDGNIDKIQQKYTDIFSVLGDAGSQCEYLIKLGLGKNTAEALRTDQNRVGGCRTAIWIRAERKGGYIQFTWDSDSLLVRGILAIFEEIYSGSSPAEAASHPPIFLKHVSDYVIYPEIKNNGLLRCYEILRSV